MLWVGHRSYDGQARSLICFPPAALKLCRMADATDISLNDLLFTIVCAIVDYPEQVKVETASADESTILTVWVHPDDTGKIIGKQGKNIKALRTIFGGAGMKLRRRIVLAIADRTSQTGLADLGRTTT
jgi:uncharacterized protein